MVRSTEELAVERMATRGFGAKKIATTLGVWVATTKRWLRRLRSDGDMASRNIGRPRGAEARLCDALDDDGTLCLVPQAKGLCSRQRRHFLNSDLEVSHRTAG